MPKLKPGTILPTAEENEAINRGIAADPDTYELSEAEFKQLKPMGRPRLQRPKVTLNMRVDAEVMDALRASGPGWQTRVNDLLRRAVRHKRI